jgi:hypothetical protein
MEDQNVSTITRRKLLKRAGAGAAIVWAAPFVTSTASAGIEPLGLKCKPCRSLCGSSQCGVDQRGCPCYCFPQAVRDGIGRRCACMGNFFCSSAIACSRDADCPPSWPCTFNCCGQTCAPPCGHPAHDACFVGGGGGLTAAG